MMVQEEETKTITKIKTIIALYCSSILLLSKSSYAYTTTSSSSIIIPSSTSSIAKYTPSSSSLLLSFNPNNNNEDDKGIILTNSFLKDRASLLESAFDAMDDKDKYDAVLTGLCSKVLDAQTKNNAVKEVNDIADDATLTTTELALKTMSDPIRLLEEMNSRRVKASSRSLMALIDVS